MRSNWFLVTLICGTSLLAMAIDGCGGNSGSTPACGNGNSCQETDLACSRPCGQGQVMLCECGTGTLAGTLVCGTCMRTDAGVAPPGGGGGRGAGGTTGRGAGGTTGGMAGGRTGRGGTTGGPGGMTGMGGRTGRGTGGTSGTGGVTAPPSDAGTPTCPANVQAGGVACTPSATPICQTACVNGMYNICTCSSNVFVCPTDQVACP